MTSVDISSVHLVNLAMLSHLRSISTYYLLFRRDYELSLLHLGVLLGWSLVIPVLVQLFSLQLFDSLTDLNSV